MIHNKYFSSYFRFCEPQKTLRPIDNPQKALRPSATLSSLENA